MSTDAEMQIYGKAAIYLRKPEKERMEAQAAPFDSKNACYVSDVKELYLKGLVTARADGKCTVTVTNPDGSKQVSLIWKEFKFNFVQLLYLFKKITNSKKKLKINNKRDKKSLLVFCN